MKSAAPCRVERARTSWKQDSYTPDVALAGVVLEEGGGLVLGQLGRLLDDPAVAAAHGLERDERRAGPEGRDLPWVEAAEVEKAGSGRRDDAPASLSSATSATIPDAEPKEPPPGDGGLAGRVGCLEEDPRGAEDDRHGASVCEDRLAARRRPW